MELFRIILFLPCVVFINNGVVDGVSPAVFTLQDSVEAQDSSTEPPVVQFPMLDIFSKPEKPTGVKINNRANSGLIGEKTVRFRKTYRDGTPKCKPQPEVKVQESNSVPDYFSNSIDAVLQSPPPPPYNETARMARYVVAYSNWTSMATRSSRKPVVGFPFSNILSISDGPMGSSTGVPYFYLTPLDMSVIDLKANNKASISMTLAQGEYCRLKKYDPEDPRCARVILTGRVVKVPEGSDEETAAKAALFSRHAGMSDWPKGEQCKIVTNNSDDADHGFFCAKLTVENIFLLDYFGGAKTVPVEEYFTTSPY